MKLTVGLADEKDDDCQATLDLLSEIENRGLIGFWMPRVSPSLDRNSISQMQRQILMKATRLTLGAMLGVKPGNPISIASKIVEKALGLGFRSNIPCRQLCVRTREELLANVNPQYREAIIALEARTSGSFFLTRKGIGF